MAPIDFICLDKKALVSNWLPVDEISIKSFDCETSKQHALNFVYREGTITESRHVNHLPLSVLTSTTKSNELCMGDMEFVRKECDYLDEQKIKEVRERVTKFSDHGFHSLAVATKQDDGTSKFICILPLFEPPLPQVAGILRKFFNLGVDVKIMTTDSLTIAKMVSKRIGIGANMLPPCVFYSGYSDPPRAALPLKKLVETSSGFYEVSLRDKVSMLDAFREGKHICGFTGVVDVDTTVLKNADIGISLSDATNSARISFDIALSDHGIPSIFKAVITGRVILQQSKTCVCYLISNVYNGISALLIDLIWNVKVPPFLIMLIVCCNYVTVACTLYAKPKPSMSPNKLKPTLMTGGTLTGAVIGVYLMTMTIVFFILLKHVNEFPSIFKLEALEDNRKTTAIYLQISIMSQASMFVISEQNLPPKEFRDFIFPSIFVLVQLATTLTSVNADLFGSIQLKSSWAGAIWCYSFLVFVPLHVIKVAIESLVFGKVKWHKRDKSLTLDD